MRREGVATHSFCSGCRPSRREPGGPLLRREYQRGKTLFFSQIFLGSYKFSKKCEKNSQLFARADWSLSLQSYSRLRDFMSRWVNWKTRKLETRQKPAIRCASTSVQHHRASRREQRQRAQTRAPALTACRAAARDVKQAPALAAKPALPARQRSQGGARARRPGRRAGWRTRSSLGRNGTAAAVGARDHRPQRRQRPDRARAAQPCQRRQQLAGHLQANGRAALADYGHHGEESARCTMEVAGVLGTPPGMEQ